MSRPLENSGIVEVCRTCFKRGSLTSGGIGVPCLCDHACEHDTVKIQYRVVDVTLRPDWTPCDDV